MTHQAHGDNVTNSQPKRRLWLLLVPMVIVLLVAAWAAQQPFDSPSAAADSAKSAPKPLPVNTQTIQYESKIFQTRSYTGTIRARQSSDLAFEFPGTIVEILVSEGDEVQRGQTLARLDTRTLKARQAAVAAQLDQAKAVLAELDAGPRAETINAAREQMNASDSNFRMAKLNFQRRQKLFESNAISAEEFDQARFGFESAKANLQSAKEQLAELESGTRAEKLTAQAATLRQLESSLAEVDVSLSKSQLKAPFAGTVSRRQVDSGSIANASVPVVRLIESSALEALIGLPADIAATLETGSTHELRVGNRTVSARLRSRVREIDPVTRTRNILLDIDASDVERIVPGELCEWNITQQGSHSGFWIPSSALTRGMRGLWSVMVVEPTESGTYVAKKHDVEIVLTESKKVLVRGTLTDGDEIVVDGVHRIADGQRVLAVEAP